MITEEFAQFALMVAHERESKEETPERDNDPIFCSTGDLPSDYNRHLI